MLKFSRLHATACLLAFAQQVHAVELTHPGLREQLLLMRELDQKFRTPGNIDPKQQDVLDVENQTKLREIIKNHGFPTLPMVGKDGVGAAWLVIQHADQQRAFQLEVLQNLEVLSAQGLVPKPSYAYLYDRVHKPQRYGTQGQCNAEGQWEPFAIENSEAVDERRAQMGMEPFSQYQQMATEYLCRKK